MTHNGHIIPNFLLCFFKDQDGKFYYLNKTYKNIGHCSTENACSSYDTYEIKRNFCNGEKYLLCNHIENGLSVRENEYSRLCKKIISVCNNPYNKFALILNHDEKELLAEFVMNLHLRNPDRLPHYKDESYSELKNNGFFKELEELKSQYPDEDITKMLDGSVDFVLTKESVLSMDGKGLLYYYKQKLLSEGSFCIIKSDEDDFVISDNVGGCSKDGFIVIPISPRYSILVSFDKHFKSKHQQNRLCTVDDSLEISQKLYRESVQYVYGKKSTLEKLKKNIK